MKKCFLKLFVLVLIGIFILTSCFDSNSDITPETNSDQNSIESSEHIEGSTSAFSNEDSQSTNKQQVVTMFLLHGEYLDGTYSIRKYSQVGDCGFSYVFSYKPEIDMFNCGALVTTYGQFATLYDYGSVTFSWGDFENALFYGYHEMSNVASIHFDLSLMQPQSNMSFARYTYTVRSNSFRNLTNKGDIDPYAETVFECINQSLSYSQSVLYGYTSTVTLW